MSHARRLEGRKCLIVGGTGGIGQAAARRFLEEGAKVAVAGYEAKDAAGLPAQLPAPLAPRDLKPLRGLGPVAGWWCDARDSDQVVRLFAQALDWLGGRLDVLFHVAGISGRRFGDGPLDECTDEGWAAVMTANALSTFLTNREAVRQMLEQPLDESGLRGTVLNTGSVLDQAPAPEHFATLAYAASKGAIRALTRSAAAYYVRDHIRFNLLVPALIDTPMAARAVGDPAIRAYLATKQPMTAGPGAADDVAQAAVFLCEPAARFVTGVELAVDGGWSISEGQSLMQASS